MKLKYGVTIERVDGLYLRGARGEQQVAKEDVYIMEKILNDGFDDAKLLDVVADTEQCDALAAGFRLAQFVRDYSDYIMEPEENPIIQI